jgi:hypothetical protein
VRDARAETLQAALARSGDIGRRAESLLGVREVFGDELGESAVFRALVADGLARLDAGRPPRDVPPATARG